MESENIRGRCRSRGGRHRRRATESLLRWRVRVCGSHRGGGARVGRRRRARVCGRRGACVCGRGRGGRLVIARRSYGWYDGPGGVTGSSGRGGRIGRRGWRLEALTVRRWSTEVASHGSRVGWRRNRCRLLGCRSRKSQQICLVVAIGIWGGSRVVAGSVCRLSQVCSAFIDRCFDGSAKIRIFLFPGQGDISLQVAGWRSSRARIIVPVSTRHTRVGNRTLDTDLKDLWHGKKRLPVQR
mmetsp:Transcript_7139/g.14571  ORF Transcript_7139/g.14571 Transcript_7139/m.14571 type:complete len:240 (+) Transcript_7139:2503-3222(+)